MRSLCLGDGPTMLSLHVVSWCCPLEFFHIMFPLATVSFCITVQINSWLNSWRGLRRFLCGSLSSPALCSQMAPLWVPPPPTFLWPENFLKAVHAGKFGSLLHYFPFSHKSLIFAYIYVFKTVVYICPVFFFFLKEGEPFPTTSSRESSCLYFTWKKILSCISL